MGSAGTTSTGDERSRSEGGDNLSPCRKASANVDVHEISMLMYMCV